MSRNHQGLHRLDHEQEVQKGVLWATTSKTRCHSSIIYFKKYNDNHNNYNNINYNKIIITHGWTTKHFVSMYQENHFFFEVEVMCRCDDAFLRNYDDELTDDAKRQKVEGFWTRSESLRCQWSTEGSTMSIAIILETCCISLWRFSHRLLKYSAFYIKPCWDIMHILKQCILMLHTYCPSQEIQEEGDDQIDDDRFCRHWPDVTDRFLVFVIIFHMLVIFFHFRGGRMNFWGLNFDKLNKYHKKWNFLYVFLLFCSIVHFIINSLE